MKKVIRSMVFETNSSSTNSVSITSKMLMCTQDDFNKWENGEILYNTENNSLISYESIRKNYQNNAMAAYKETCSKDKYRIPWEKLTLSLQNEWIEQYVKINCRTYLNYSQFKELYETVDIAKFVASNGVVIVAICGIDYESDYYD